jgi:hypothetical protein
MEDLIQRTTLATIASLSAADDVSVITTPTPVNANTTVNSMADNKRKSPVPDGALKRFRPNIHTHKVYIPNVRRTTPVGQTLTSIPVDK